MSRKFPQALFLLILGFISLAMPQHSLASVTGGGTCPAGANYIDLTNPSNGNGYGSIALTATNAGGITSCYYFSSTGSDTSTGLDESHPLQHLPGMANCTSNCAAITPAAGNGFIIEGGSVYHYTSGTPNMGGVWTWPSSNGTSSNYIYIGIDPTWYSGGSFARPIVNFDNALSTSLVGSCTSAPTGNLISFTNATYLIVEGLEVKGVCSAGSSNIHVMEPHSGGHEIFERLYFHGWSHATGASDNIVFLGDQGNSPDATIRDLFNVIDGQDSTYGNACTSASCVPTCYIANCGTGWGIGYGYDVEYNVIHHTSNAIQSGNICTLIGNDLEYSFEGGNTLPSGHGNVVEAVSGTSCTNALYYGNFTANTNQGNNWDIQASTYNIFNNVWINNGSNPSFNEQVIIQGNCNGTNCVATVFWYNNTVQGDIEAGTSGGSGGGWASGSSITFQNNHIMEHTGPISNGNFFNCNGGGNVCAVTDSGNEVFQTLAAAQSNGYSIANRWTPQSSNAATVGKGADLSSSFCNRLPNSLAISACQAGSAGAVSEISAWGGQFAYYPYTTANSRGSTWDAGVYQFSSGSTLSPPTGLSALVQ